MLTKRDLTKVHDVLPLGSELLKTRLGEFELKRGYFTIHQKRIFITYSFNGKIYNTSIVRDNNMGRKI